MTILKIISGGQTGVDIAALRAARAENYATGGTCPKGWRTEAGPQPDLLRSFGLFEHESEEYPARTRANVEESDCTLIISDVMDGGSQHTAELCVQLRKPFLPVMRANIGPGGEDDVIAWFHAVPHEILNVAGNRESKSPGIEAEAEEFLRRLFALAGDEL
jgi:hypothetical protein